MNCYEFTAIDKMKLSFEVGGSLGFTGSQTNTSSRPGSRICLQCKYRETFQDQVPPPLPPRKYNQCTKSEFSALAIRQNATCFRFRTTKLAWNDSVSISSASAGAVYYLSFQQGHTTNYVYPPLLKPWDEQDPYYDNSLLYYNAKKNSPYSLLACKMWIRDSRYFNAPGIPISFSEFETGSVGYFEEEGQTITVGLTITFE